MAQVRDLLQRCGGNFFKLQRRHTFDRDVYSLLRIGCLGQAFRQRHLERVSLHQALRPEDGFDRRLCAAIFDRGMEVDFHWVTDSIYNQKLQPVELYVADEL